MKPYVGELVQFIRYDGVVYELNSPPTRGLLSMTGWGKPPEEMHTLSGPYQHGETWVSYRLKPRTLNLEIAHPHVSRSEWFNGRSALLEEMGLNSSSPNSPQTGVLRWSFLQNGSYVTRDVDVYLSRGLGFAPLDGYRMWTIAEGLEFVALNPVIYEPTVRTSSITTYTSSLIFPVTFPFVLGASYGTTTITYAGTWETYPTITVTGPAVGVYIENTTTGKKLRLDYTISAGETVTFNLTFNVKTITSSTGQDLLQYLSDDSDLGEFSLINDPIVANGTNVIVVYAIGATAATAFTFTYYNRYYGI